MNISKTKLFTIVVLLAVALLFSGCAKKTGDNTTAGNGDTTVPENKTDGGNTGAGVKKQVGNGGFEASLACADQTNIYYLDMAGKFFIVDMETGTGKEIGDTGRSDAEYLFTAGNAVYMITAESGTLFAIDKSNAQLTQKGADDECMNILECTVYNDKLYHINLNNGNLHVTDPAKGKTSDIGDTDFLDTCVLTAGKDVLYAMQRDGNLFHINPVTGQFRNAGTNASWDSTFACVYLDGWLYTAEAMGILLKVNPDTAEYEGLADDGFKTTIGMFPFRDGLATIDEDGFIYHVAVK